MCTWTEGSDETARAYAQSNRLSAASRFARKPTMLLGEAEDKLTDHRQSAGDRAVVGQGYWVLCTGNSDYLDEWEEETPRHSERT